MEGKSVGYSVHNLENQLNVIELLSMIDNGVAPSYIIFHQNYLKRKLLDFISWLKSLQSGRSAERRKIGVVLRNAKVYNIRDINSDDAQFVLNTFAPTLLIANSGIIRKKTIDSNPEVYFINKHGSKLPEFRGVSNLEWALLNESMIYGSILRIHHGIDEGDILEQEPINFQVDDFETLGDFIYECQKELFGRIGKAVSSYLAGDIDFRSQSDLGVELLQYYSIHPLLREVLLRKLGKSI